jgi:outer membrane protein TolC
MFNMDKLPAYYKTVSQYGVLESMIAMLDNEISQKKIALNSLMARDISTSFEIDSTYLIRDFYLEKADTALLARSRSDLRAIDKTMKINELRIEAEKSNLLPEFGLKYDHMFAFGELPQQFTLMMMVNIPFAPWASKMNKSNQHSYRSKNESLQFQRQMILNETSGMLYAMQTEFKNLNKQYEIANRNILPALKKNYDTALLAWQNNTGDLSAVQEAWEALNMAQLDALDKLEAILVTQVEIERQLEIY